MRQQLDLPLDPHYWKAWSQALLGYSGFYATSEHRPCCRVRPKWISHAPGIDPETKGALLQGIQDCEAVGRWAREKRP